MMNGLGELRFDSLKVRLDFLRYSEESDWRKAIENPPFSAVPLRRQRRTTSAAVAIGIQNCSLKEP